MKASIILTTVLCMTLASCACVQRVSLEWTKTAQKSLDSVVLIRTGFVVPNELGIPTMVHGIGSGAVLSKDGWIVTNAHVLMNGDEAPAEMITVKFQDERVFAAEKFYLFPNYDLALIKIDVSNEPFLKVRAKEAEVGEPCLSIGNPVPYQFVVKEGIVSQNPFTPYGSSEDDDEELSPEFSLIAHSATIMPGNSGGPLVDINGNIIGINEAYIRSKPIYGLAISARTLIHILDIVSIIELHDIYTKA
jgi:S1-C subfamily serine protease